MTGRREQNKDDKRRRIREAAWRLFGELGYDGATTKAIAKAAGIASGTLFLYARDKSTLLFLLFHDELTRISNERAASVPEGAPLIDQLVHLFGGFYERYESSPELARRFAHEILRLEGDKKAAYDDLNRQFFARLAGVLERGRQRGLVASSVNTGISAMNLFAIYGFQVLTWLDQPRPVAAHGIAALRVAFEQVAVGLAPRG